ncbi:hypothetical protein LP316_01135 [Thalassotalea sp. LPB0316]|uniref:hypothetical protein n=1 Tax=Thalassotalea sp. LPB0316 TaxID=2769490 RepID=UPI001869278D|nr:hypothetical protein [Thalassotalea sp. LPB0316]QOL25950.1 hypothetical protein LP316_01135 [Thalassotalea sp. LPB0316]
MKNINEKLASPITFWGSIGVAISASLTVSLKLSVQSTVLTILGGLAIGCIIGFLTKRNQNNCN